MREEKSIREICRESDQMWEPPAGCGRVGNYGIRTSTGGRGLTSNFPCGRGCGLACEQALWMKESLQGSL